MKDEREDVRINATSALVYFPSEDIGSLRNLTKIAQTDTSWLVRANAAEAIAWSLARPSTTMLAELEGYARVEETEEVRQALVRAVTWFRRRPEERRSAHAAMRKARASLGEDSR